MSEPAVIVPKLPASHARRARFRWALLLLLLLALISALLWWIVW
jgi:hypothetical protein